MMDVSSTVSSPGPSSGAHMSHEEAVYVTRVLPANGGIYKGYVNKMGQRHGMGIHTTRRGDVFEGEFKEEKRNGQGTYRWTSGDMYMGEWQDGFMHGQGTFRWASQDEYTGSWRHGRMYGHGTKRMVNGDSYTGEWRDDSANGHGVKNFACGDRHEGNYVEDKRHGYGVYVWKNGDTYSGSWHNGEMHGQGMKVLVNGDTYEGQWVNGSAEGYGKKTFASGHTHEGYYSKDTRHGFGVYTWENGDRYEGYWCEGEQHGKGTYYYEHDIVYQGIWLSGAKHGRGILTINGVSFDEVWQCGERISKTQRETYVPCRAMRTVPPPPETENLDTDGFGGKMRHLTSRDVQASIIREEIAQLQLQLKKLEKPDVRSGHQHKMGGAEPARDHGESVPLKGERKWQDVEEMLSQTPSMPSTPMTVTQQQRHQPSPFTSPAPVPLHMSKNNFENPCRVCFENTIDTVLLKCGHIAICWGCSNQLEKCPLCRMQIVDVVRTYTS